MSNSKLEKVIENKIKKFLVREYHHGEQIYFVKNHGGEFTESGRHDIFICFRGRFVSIETKGMTGYKLQPDQWNSAKLITNAGGISILGSHHFNTYEEFIGIWEYLKTNIPKVEINKK